jgi:hypothetical protein
LARTNGIGDGMIDHRPALRPLASSKKCLSPSKPSRESFRATDERSAREDRAADRKRDRECPVRAEPIAAQETDCDLRHGQKPRDQENERLGLNPRRPRLTALLEDA